MTIYGAGVIGCEHAFIMASPGAKENLVDSRYRLLTFLDDEIADALSYHLRQQGGDPPQRELREGRRGR